MGTQPQTPEDPSLVEVKTNVDYRAERTDELRRKLSRIHGLGGTAKPLATIEKKMNQKEKGK